MVRAVRAHPGVFIAGGLTFVLVEHFLMHRGGMGKIQSAAKKSG